MVDGILVWPRVGVVLHVVLRRVSVAARLVDRSIGMSGVLFRELLRVGVGQLEAVALVLAALAVLRRLVGLGGVGPCFFADGALSLVSWCLEGPCRIRADIRSGRAPHAVSFQRMKRSKLSIMGQPGSASKRTPATTRVFSARLHTMWTGLLIWKPLKLRCRRARL